MKIETVEQLEALPVGTVILSKGRAIQLHERAPGKTWWRASGSGFWEDKTSITLPATVLIPSVITIGQLHSVEDAIDGLDWTQLEHGITPETMEIAHAVLTALGVEVEK